MLIRRLNLPSADCLDGRILRRTYRAFKGSLLVYVDGTVLC